MKILMSMGAWIKTHIVTTAIISTVVVGGSIATPIIVNNINNNQNKTEVKEKHEEEVGTTTCEDGYELVDNKCVEIKQEEPQEEPRENDTNDTNTNTSTSVKNHNKEGENTNTNTNTSTNKTNNNQTNDPQESKPSCNDISCKITESNRIVYYEGKMLFGIKVYQPYGYDVDGWQYNSSLIQSLSKEDRNYVFNNYFKKETYCSTNHRTSSNCLKYSAFEDRMDDIIKTSEDENYYNSSKSNIKKYTDCINYLKNGTLADNRNKDEMDDMCHQKDTEKFKWDINDFQAKLDEANGLYNLHNNVINESKGYKQAYQTTRSLLQQ